MSNRLLECKKGYLDSKPHYSCTDIEIQTIEFKRITRKFNCSLALLTKNMYIHGLSNFKIFITFDKKSYFRID